MTALTLPEFLLARIAEDEAAARASEPMRLGMWGQSTTIAERVLAECAAKRQIVRLAQGAPEDQRSFQSPMIDVLLAHAAVYADHPDYREEWKP